jgi:hypothetical protein
MNNFEIKNELLQQLSELSYKKYGNELSYVGLWGCASAILTVEQLEIIKSVMEK